MRRFCCLVLGLGTLWQSTVPPARPCSCLPTGSTLAFAVFTIHWHLYGLLTEESLPRLCSFGHSSPLSCAIVRLRPNLRCTRPLNVDVERASLPLFGQCPGLSARIRLLGLFFTYCINLDNYQTRRRLGTLKCQSKGEIELCREDCVRVRAPVSGGKPGCREPTAAIRPPGTS